MIPEKIQGLVYVIGNDINTDVIIPARHINTMDPDYLGKHAMEDLNPEQYPIPFLNPDGTCDYKIILAGRNFGCGSSREHAPIALRAAGIESVVAVYFSRIYRRSCINDGNLTLPAISQTDLTSYFKTRDNVEIDLVRNKIINRSERAQLVFPLVPFEGIAKEILEAGGLTAYNKKRLGLV